jgi:hypothetical protein
MNNGARPGENRNPGSPSLGGHGRPASFSGSDGSKISVERGMEMGRSTAFDKGGSPQGAHSAIPERDKTGAFECDESCQGYTGDSHDGGGPRGRPAGTNRVPEIHLRNEGAR